MKQGVLISRAHGGPQVGPLSWNAGCCASPTSVEQREEPSRGSLGLGEWRFPWAGSWEWARAAPWWASLCSPQRQLSLGVCWVATLAAPQQVTGGAWGPSETGTGGTSHFSPKSLHNGAVGVYVGMVCGSQGFGARADTQRPFWWLSQLLG